MSYRQKLYKVSVPVTVMVTTTVRATDPYDAEDKCENIDFDLDIDIDGSSALCVSELCEITDVEDPYFEGIKIDEIDPEGIDLCPLDH